MNNLDVVVLDGNLTADPETKKTKTGKVVTTFTIAMNHEWGAKDGNKHVSFISIETWERLAENCAEFLKKGSKVTVNGSLRQDRWQDDDGKTQSKIKVLAQVVRFDGKKAGEKEAA